MRYEITLNGKVYEVDVEDNRALLGAIESARPFSDEELAEHPALANRMVSNISRAATSPRPTAGPVRVGTAAGAPVRRVAPPGARPVAAAARTAPGAASAASPAPGPVAVKGEAVTAPMPGLIKDIRVQTGQRVKAGQVMVILEAMKMENEIVAPTVATVTEVTVSKGQTVSAGVPLLKLAK